MIPKTNTWILLTGAGFSKNFGGFLASEMWFKMFNHPLAQANEFIKSKLLESQDFEQVYSDILESGNTEAQKVIGVVIEDAYKELDESIDRRPLMRSDTCNTYDLETFFSAFHHPKDGGSALFFTLNQDLLRERHNGYHWLGIRPVGGAQRFPPGNLPASQFTTLDPSITKEQLYEQLKNGFGYVKLHGSYGWKSSDGSNRMVVGKNKTGIIESEPLLKAYFDIFKETIQSGDKKLMIIGYGFGDKHINDVLIDGVKNHNLGLYIISASDLPSLRSRVSEEDARLIFGTGLKHFVQMRNLGDIFPFDQSIKSTEGRSLVKLVGSPWI